MSKSVQVYIGMGSNTDADLHLCAALEQLQDWFGCLTRSTVYQSAAVGFVGPAFFNLVIGFTTDLSVQALKRRLRQLEQQQGRTRDQSAFNSRTLDLDVLLYGDVIKQGEKLPHPDIITYPFVLFPLAELAPNCIHPVLQQPLAAIAQQSALERSSLMPVRLNC